MWFIYGNHEDQGMQAAQARPSPIPSGGVLLVAEATLLTSPVSVTVYYNGIG
jgi:hypothetical protein